MPVGVRDLESLSQYLKISHVLWLIFKFFRLEYSRENSPTSLLQSTTEQTGDWVHWLQTRFIDNRLLERNRAKHPSFVPHFVNKRSLYFEIKQTKWNLMNGKIRNMKWQSKVRVWSKLL